MISKLPGKFWLPKIPRGSTKGSGSETLLCSTQGPRGRSGLKGDRGDTGEPVSDPRKSGKNRAESRGGKNVDQEQGTAADPKQGKGWFFPKIIPQRGLGCGKFGFKGRYEKGKSLWRITGNKRIGLGILCVTDSSI